MSSSGVTERYSSYYTRLHIKAGISHQTSLEDLQKQLSKLKDRVKNLRIMHTNTSSGNISLHELELLSDDIEALVKAVLLKKQRSNPQKSSNAKNSANYKINYANSANELTKLRGYEKKLEQKLNILIDSHAKTHELSFARTRLQRCRDAIGQLLIHIQTTENK
ncbi:hypothetical protein [Echinimonas agarilytica]|uniref:Uncharacterized protein n=1 Tax=Echinimonas agarilytica TaxID=1215918 RepID=A0AA41W6J2_9GAMM|nr:hypothetical protein [Echinimonas agarilytica]MCM2679819.1 hypothetical protein [Echinimonas agarilytica]